MAGAGHPRGRVWVERSMARSADDGARATVHRWGRWEGELISDRDRVNPVQEVTLDVALTSPSGLRRRASGFWDGGNVWRVRFSPDEVGEWRFETTCSDAADA